MTKSALHFRLAAIVCIALPCVGGLNSSVVVGVKANSVGAHGYVALTAADTVPICDKPETPVELKGSKTKFNFKCPAGATLEPVEGAAGGGALGRGTDFTSVYQFSPASRQSASKPACNKEPAVLDTLVPGSSLKKLSPSGMRKALQQKATETEFELTIGEAEQDTHLCYICSGATGPGAVPGAQHVQTACTVYVTVPQKQKPPADGPSDSGSFSPSGFGWLTLSVTGLALGLIFRP